MIIEDVFMAVFVFEAVRAIRVGYYLREGFSRWPRWAEWASVTTLDLTGINSVKYLPATVCVVLSRF